MELIAMTAFAGLIFLTLFQVLSRYVFSVPIAFSEEVGRFLFIWISFLGAAIVMKRNEHIRLDLLIGKIPPKAYTIIQVLVFALTAMFSVLIFYNGYTMLDVAFRQIAPVSRLSMGYVYAVIPAAALFMAIFSVIHLVKTLIGLKGKGK